MGNFFYLIDSFITIPCKYNIKCQTLSSPRGLICDSDIVNTTMYVFFTSQSVSLFFTCSNQTQCTEHHEDNPLINFQTSTEVDQDQVSQMGPEGLQHSYAYPPETAQSLKDSRRGQHWGSNHTQQQAAAPTASSPGPPSRVSQAWQANSGPNTPTISRAKTSQVMDLSKVEHSLDSEV